MGLLVHHSNAPLEIRETYYLNELFVSYMT